MTLPHLLKTLCAIGTPAVSISSWQLYEYSQPTVDMAMWMEGYSWNPVSAKFNLEDGYGLSNLEGNRCYFGMFGTGKWKYEDELIFSQSVYKSRSQRTMGNFLVNPAPVDTPSKAVGCAFFRFKNVYRESSKTQMFYLLGDVVLKNSSRGIAVRTFGAYRADIVTGKSRTPSPPYIDYTILFLEKTNTGTWIVKSGYNWMDSTLNKTTENTFTPFIKLPTGVWFGSGLVKNVQRYYAGIWEENARGEEIFSSIKIQKDSGTPGEILGRSTTTPSTSNPGYKKSTFFYYGQGWNKLEDPDNWSDIAVDAENSIKTWHQPFDGKKGIWKDLKTYCSSLKHSRGVKNNAYLFDNMTSLCYSKI